MDLTRLTPAPCEADDTHLVSGRGVWPDGRARTLRETAGFAKFNQAADAEFAALAWNAFAGDPEALAWWEANRVHPQEIQP
jgi:hypothetical protein